MKKLTVLASAAALTLAFAAPSQAALVTAGGITWDTNWADGGEFDFQTQFDFTQWYAPTSGPGSSATPGSITNYNSAVSIATVLGQVDGGAGATDYTLQGTGEVYRLNGISGADFLSGVELTLAFGGIILNKDSTFDISGAWAKLFSDDSPEYTHPLSGDLEVANALDGITWLDLSFTSLAFTDGTVQNGVVSAEFNITGGVAAQYFDPKSLTYTADASFNPNALYSTGGNGNAVGNTNVVPEPGSLALLGLGLFGIAAMRKRSA